MRQSVITLACVVVLLPCALAAQGDPSSQAGVVVTARQVREAITAADSAPTIDRMLRLVPIRDEYQVAVAVIRRSNQNGSTPVDALAHSEITEVYQILEGRGVLVTGGTLVASRPLDPAGDLVRHVIGPTSRGARIDGGTSTEVGPGDVIIVPPNTAHGFVELLTPEIRYLLIRVDPHRVIKAR